MLFIDRDYEKIIGSRTELKHDYKMEGKISTYRRMALQEEWFVINNNDSIENTKKQILDVLDQYKTR